MSVHPVRARRRVLLASVAVLTAALAVLGLPVTAQARSAAPAAVTSARATSVTATSAVLTWTNPRSTVFRTVVVRRANGTAAPTSPTRGYAVAVVARTRHAVTVSRLAPGTVSSFALFASDGHGHVARPAVVRVQTLPGPVSALAGVTTPTSVRLTWRASASPTVTALVARYQAGTTAPPTPTSGQAVAVPSARTTSATVAGLTPATRYAVAVWARDRLNHWSAPARVVVTTRPAPPVVVTPPPGGAIAGRVFGPDGSGATGVGVTVFAAAGGHLAAFDRRTDGGGAYRVDGLPVGTYRICFDATSVDPTYLRLCNDGVPWTGDPTAPAAAAQAVPVTANATTTLPTAVLGAPSSLTGQVTAATDGSALGGVRVWLLDPSGGPVDTTTTGDDGTYRLTSIVPGRYLVCFSAGDVGAGPSAHGYAGQCGGVAWTGGAVPAAAAVKTVTAGAAEVDAVLAGVGDTTDVGAVAGTVTASGGPVAGVTVTAYDNGGGVQGSAVTDGTGGYTIAGLPSSSDRRRHLLRRRGGHGGLPRPVLPGGRGRPHQPGRVRPPRPGHRRRHRHRRRRRARRERLGGGHRHRPVRAGRRSYRRRPGPRRHGRGHRDDGCRRHLPGHRPGAEQRRVLRVLRRHRHLLRLPLRLRGSVRGGRTLGRRDGAAAGAAGAGHGGGLATRGRTRCSPRPAR